MDSGQGRPEPVMPRARGGMATATGPGKNIGHNKSVQLVRELLSEKRTLTRCLNC